MCFKLKIKKRYYLKKKKLREVQEKLGDYAELIGPKSKVEIIETDLPDILLVDGEPLVMMLDDEPLPTVKGALKMDIRSGYVVVDMGAVKFVAKGADVMSPGIVDADPSIEKGDLVVIIEESHKKPLAVGRSLISGPEMVESREGKAVKSLHYIGDDIWNLEI